MAEITRISGNTTPFEAVGRDLEWITLTITNMNMDDLPGSGDVGEDELERVVRTVETFCTVTIVGVPTATTVTICTEGLGNGFELTGEPADPLFPTDGEKEAEIDAILLASLADIAGPPVATTAIVIVSGVTFV